MNEPTPDFEAVLAAIVRDAIKWHEGEIPPESLDLSVQGAKNAHNQAIEAAVLTALIEELEDLLGGVEHINQPYFKADMVSAVYLNKRLAELTPTHRKGGE